MVVKAQCCFAVPEKFVQVHGVMKKEDYVDIWKDDVKKYAASLALGHHWVFQQNNGPKHTIWSKTF